MATPRDPLPISFPPRESATPPRIAPAIPRNHVIGYPPIKLTINATPGRNPLDPDVFLSVMV